MLSAQECDVFRKRILVLSAIAFVIVLATLALDLFAPFAYLHTRNLLRDAIARAGRKTPPNPDLVFLAIDSDSVGLEESLDVEQMFGLRESDSLEARSLHAMAKQWPWPREVYALILQRLVDAGAKVVLFDLTFPTATVGDEPFRLALDHYREHVVIGSNFVSDTHTRPPDSLIPQTTPMDDRVAYTNFWPDEDDVVRRARYHVSLEEAQAYTPVAGSEIFLSLGARALTKAGMADAIPPDTHDHLFRYTAAPREGFPPQSIYKIFVPEYWKRSYGSGEFFRGKIVLVGAEGNWQHDEHVTPFGSMPGPELHLNAINAALHHEFITELSHRSVLFVALTAALLAVALSVVASSPWLRLLTLVALDAAAIWATLFLFNRAALYVPSLPFLLVLNPTVLLGFVFDFTCERIEKARVRRTLEKYVSNNVVRELLDRREFQHSLGGVIKPVTILFSDIRGYTSVSAKTDPQALVSQLNEYLSAMVECVFKYGGTLDKFIGDAVMAVWGNVQSEGVATDAANAVRAGLAMRDELARLNTDWKKRGLTELRIGVAVNQGDVVVGNIGSPRRMEFTVIGDAVNVSWKLQELTKRVQSDLVVSKSVASLVVEHFEVQQLGAFDVAGFSDLFEIFGISRPIAVADAQDFAAFELP